MEYRQKYKVYLKYPETDNYSETDFSNFNNFMYIPIDCSYKLYFYYCEDLKNIDFSKVFKKSNLAHTNFFSCNGENPAAAQMRYELLPLAQCDFNFEKYKKYFYQQNSDKSGDDKVGNSDYLAYMELNYYLPTNQTYSAKYFINHENFRQNYHNHAGMHKPISMWTSSDEVQYSKITQPHYRHQDDYKIQRDGSNITYLDKKTEPFSISDVIKTNMEIYPGLFDSLRNYSPYLNDAYPKIPNFTELDTFGFEVGSLTDGKFNYEPKDITDTENNDFK